MTIKFILVDAYHSQTLQLFYCWVQKWNSLPDQIEIGIDYKTFIGIS